MPRRRRWPRAAQLSRTTTAAASTRTRLLLVSNNPHAWAIDAEAALLAPEVRVAIRPGALRVRIARLGRPTIER